MNDTLDLTIVKAEKSRLTVTDFSQLPFGKVFSDHMFIAEYDTVSGETCRSFLTGLSQ